MQTERFDTIVIGGGQAGLSTGYHLAQRGETFVILEANARIGDVWRNRFDSLRLYSPAQYDCLPGMPMPMPKLDLGPARKTWRATWSRTPPSSTSRSGPGSDVDGLAKAGDDYVISSGDTLLRATNVVIATGGWQTPVVPDFADQLDGAIIQLHSSDYRNPRQLQPGPVLVVGCAHSGADIALELAQTHAVVLSGAGARRGPHRHRGPSRAPRCCRSCGSWRTTS